jgi:hypothetical protein
MRAFIEALDRQSLADAVKSSERSLFPLFTEKDAAL